MTTNLIITGTLITILLLATLMPVLNLLHLYIFPPRKITIISKKSGKIASLDLKNTDDEAAMLEFATIFYGQE